MRSVIQYLQDLFRGKSFRGGGGQRPDNRTVDPLFPKRDKHTVSRDDFPTDGPGYRIGKCTLHGQGDDHLCKLCFGGHYTDRISTICI